MRGSTTTAVAAAALLLAASGCGATPHYEPPSATYYVAPGGDDQSSGTSPGEAWRTLARAERTGLAPGDKLLLEGGARFSGTITVGEEEAGAADRPVTVGSYGGGRATVAATNSAGISVYNTAGVEIRDVKVTGAGRSYTQEGGINIYSDREDGAKLDRVTVADVEVSGFRAGIAVGGTESGSGFRDVTVRQAEVHGNKDVGLLTYGPRFDADKPAYAHRDIRIEGVEAHHNTGDPELTETHSGNGIILGGVQEATVRSSRAHDNGTRSSAEAPAGPVGIWAYDAADVVLEENTSYRNHTGSAVDGAGFGLDANVSGSTIQNNLAFQNDGPGYYVYTNKKNGAHRENTIRYNVATENGRKLPVNGALAIHGQDIRNLNVYQNTLVMSDSPNGPGPAVRLRGGQSGVTLRNNILVTERAPLVTAEADLRPRDVVMQGNDYFEPTGSWRIDWDERTFPDLDAWRTATGQERADGRSTGLAVDPCFAGGALPDIRSAADARLIVPDCAALAGKGLDLRRLFGTEAGTVDYFGRTVGTPPPIGAAVPPASE
ncbi:right-handed parallel beta-helix repeat-containing protein [Streptomyces globisporus]|uniref:right-handed parallel beta-helix repeat-containing protein n=1 Tax=Streptomyces globisporus TaxID=1908 RepID=UPI00345FA726|nr:right-handed parallel beta-helix repeat-containing protein [Streptomyces globisporus]